MKRKSNRTEWISLIACLAMIALVFASGVLDKRKTWGTMEWNNLRFIKQDRNNPQYGVQNTGPEFNLPAGRYDLKFTVRTDGSGHVRLATTNDAPIEPAEFPFSADQTEQVVHFEVLESAKQVDIQIDFEAGTWYEMGETRLYTPFYRDNAFTFAIAALSLWLLAVLWRRGVITPERGGLLAFLALAVAFASAPAFKENLSVFHDTRYHAARLRNLADALAGGQVPARLGAFSYNGYGAITSVFYPDLFLYPFALMLLGGASIQYVMNLLLVFANALAAAAMAHCACVILKDGEAGALAAVLYVLSCYHVTDGCVRYALGEMLAMGFLPLFLEGLYEVAAGNRERWPVLACGAAAIFLSHMLSTFLAALFAAALLLPLLPRLVREGRWKALLKACAWTALLCLFQIVPMLGYARQGIGPDKSLFTTTMAGTAMAPAQLFLLGSGNLGKAPTDGTLSFMPLELGLPLWTGMALAAAALLQPDVKRSDRRLILLFLAVGWWFVFMSTTLFPWSYVSVVTDLFDRVQFAYRYLMFPALLFPICGAWAVRGLGRDSRFPLVLAAAFALSVSAILPTITEQARHYEFYEFGTDVSPDIKQFTEYCLPGADMSATRTREVRTEGGISLTGVSRRGSFFEADVDAPEDACVDLPLFAFDGYEAKIDGTKTAWERADGGRLRLRIPAGTRGRLSVRFAGKGIWRAGDAVSLLAAAIGLILIWKRRGRRNA